MIKKIRFIFVAVITALALSACEFNFNFKDQDVFTDFATEFNEAKNALFERAQSLMESQEEEEAVKQVFELDKNFLNILFLDETRYYLIIGLFNDGETNQDMQDMQNLKVTEIDDGYKLEFTDTSENQSVETEIRLLYKENSSRLTALQSGNIIYIYERVKTNDGKYACQFCFIENENYITGQFIIDGENGTYCVFSGSGFPDSIFDDSNLTDSDFASQGDRVYNVTADSFNYENDTNN